MRRWFAGMRWWLLSGLVVVVAGVVLVVALMSPADKPDQPAPPVTTMDEPALTACSLVANGKDTADTVQARVDLTNRVVESARKSQTVGFADRTISLERTADSEGGGLWTASAQAFVIICKQNGWSPS